ncbi:hypothetical protein [Mesorhizobium sp. IMUNJ 23232]|uniref:hypothetical protein n=1 Tax=Mesorhizobium sp. IMUNJ 23232 TaxID=3376064 RepID=UPI00378E9B4B
MGKFRAIGGLLAILSGSTIALAQEIPDLKGTWTPSKNGAHIIDGDPRHKASGTVPLPDNNTLQRNATKFVYRFVGQEGRTFWGVLSSTKVSEKLIGAISVDGKRFVMADEDGTFHGTIVNADTFDYCYTHVTPTSRAVACGTMLREK